MNVGDKLRYLRTVEGTLRGMDREMTQQAVSEAIERELGLKISQSYLSQIEGGRRRHLTNTSRMTLAKFFRVHPGYLVDDPEGYHTELTSDVRTLEDNLDLWLVSAAERFGHDGVVRESMLKLAKHPDSRKVLTLVSAILETPELVDRLLQVLRPEATKESP
jgi:transcriptional regulator with XRE-family HTH domain